MTFKCKRDPFVVEIGEKGGWGKRKKAR